MSLWRLLGIGLVIGGLLAFIAINVGTNGRPDE